MPYEQKFIMCDTYAHTIDMSKSSAEGTCYMFVSVKSNSNQIIVSAHTSALKNGSWSLFTDLLLLIPAAWRKTLDFMTDR